MKYLEITYKHEPISGECEASEFFSVKIPTLQDGFFDVPNLKCVWCDVEPMILSKKLRTDKPHWPTGHDHPDFVGCEPGCPEFEGELSDYQKADVLMNRRDEANIICPSCKSQSIEPQEEGWLCLTCHHRFSARDGIVAALNFRKGGRNE